jgi:citrate lyase alpha subunit
MMINLIALSFRLGFKALFHHAFNLGFQTLNHIAKKFENIGFKVNTFVYSYLQEV